MVSHSRAPLGARALRALNRPAPIGVRTDAQRRPVEVQKSVATVLDEWRIDDEWWRERPISRLYYSLLLEDGSALTVFHDLVRDRWFEQRD